ncbi:sigma 54-interacting transcriptional regulator [Neobacillus novalis]|uniref:Sigma 54-interacting transcriptional regulator n=1 Tax=Neobacillus novalis TaxID=220687 RepID=A0AA95S9A2_9BACI|nr:sigma 54-interacting transcriptional regulator [Neobacillus novalis]WHY84029.1 sigma 54-interacting transcriptional regulator [Neobacillus novalis]
MATERIDDILLKEIITHSFDEIFITDCEGNVLEVSPSCYELYGVDPDQLIGGNVVVLEKKGFLNPSVTALVLKSQQPITIIQETKARKKVLVSAYPIFENGKLVRTLSFSRDITEFEKLKERNEQVADTLAIYKKEIENIKRLESFLYENPKMTEIISVVSKVANLNVTVLIEGKSGVGKSRIAHLLHKQSVRAIEPFIEVNCGAIPETLFESELFGYEEGAFTGAKRGGKKGYFELAGSGTIFLDEIGEIPLNLQVKLLSVLQNRRITRIGGSNVIDINCRIVCATNQSLRRLVEDRKFREDLYYRIDVVKLVIPTLRERIDEIPTLIHDFVEVFNKKYHLTKEFSPEMIDWLCHKEWPGNVRELQNYIEKTMVTSNEDIIHFTPPHQVPRGMNEEPSLTAYMESIEKEYIKRKYKKYPNSIALAKALQISQSSANRKIQKYIKNLVSHF